MYALIKNGAVSKYPYSVTDMRLDNKNISFPREITDSQLEAFGVFVVYETPMPQITVLQIAEEASPVFNNGRWEKRWAVRDKTQEEFDSYKRALVVDITAQTQERLDTFARTRNYDNILSACTYAASTVPKFRDEGQYCVNARDATWASLYQFMAEVEAGTRPVPSGYADVEPSLPALEWPA